MLYTHVGRTVQYTPCPIHIVPCGLTTTPIYLSVLSHCTTWDRWDCTRDSYVHRLGMQILSVRPIPLYHMGWMGCTGDSLIHTHYACKSSLSILSHCTTWDGWDCTRDSYVHTLCMQILSVHPIPLYHMR